MIYSTKFIWSNQTQKINRKTLTLDYNMGDIKMIELEHFTVARKVTWLRRLIQNNTPCVELFKHQIIKDTNKLFYLGAEFTSSVI